MLDRRKDRFVYARKLGERVYVVDCNLGGKPCRAFSLKGKWKLVYDTVRAEERTVRTLQGYEARILLSPPQPQQLPVSRKHLLLRFLPQSRVTGRQLLIPGQHHPGVFPGSRQDRGKYLLCRLLFNKLLRLRREEKAFIYGAFRVLDRRKDRFVYAKIPSLPAPF